MELNVFASTVLYLAVFLVAGLLAYVGQRNKRYTLVALAVILPALLAGFRYGAGTDSLTYRDFYAQVGGESFAASMSRINSGTLEPFIVLICRLGNLLHLDASFVFFIFGLITTVFLYLATRAISKETAWLYYGMLLIIVFPESFNIMRQLAAVAVQAYVLAYIYTNKRHGKKVSLPHIIVLSLFSIFLHYSSLLLLPVLLLPSAIKYIRGKSLYCVLAALAIAIVFAFPTMINMVASMGLLSQKHLQTLFDSAGSIINVKFFAAAILTVVYAVNYRRSGHQRDKFLSFLMLVGAVYSAVGFYSGYVGRMANFFWVFIVVALVDLIGQLTTKKYTRVAVCLAVGILYFVVYYAVLGFNAIIPYDFI